MERSKGNAEDPDQCHSSLVRLAMAFARNQNPLIVAGVLSRFLYSHSATE